MSVIDWYVVSIGTDSGITKVELTLIAKKSSYSTDTEMQRVAKAANQKHLVVAMLCGANRGDMASWWKSYGTILLRGVTTNLQF